MGILELLETRHRGPSTDGDSRIDRSMERGSVYHQACLAEVKYAYYVEMDSASRGVSDQVPAPFMPTIIDQHRYRLFREAIRFEWALLTA